jgi:hypothetical protein
MTCKDENPTRHNRATLLHVRNALSDIGDVWIVCRTLHADRLRHRRMRRKVRAWKRDMRGFRRDCRQLLHKYKADPSTVTPGDWDKITAGKENKLQITCGKRYAKEKWPATIPYLNLIAYAEYCTVRKAARAAQKARKAAVLENKAAAASRKAEASAKQVEPLENETKIADTLPWRGPIALEAFFKALEHKGTRLEWQVDLLRRSRRNPASVSYEQ